MPPHPPAGPAATDEGRTDERQIDDLLGRLTRHEKCLLTAGSDTWHGAGVPGAGIGALKVTDGPSGARGATFGQVPSACFPCGTALGATWDPALVEAVGAAIAREARRKGARVLLAPTVNIHRHPLAGRNFECPSEDPLLTSAYVVAYVTGVQSQGVAATVKHFVCNDSEFERRSISSEVGERALREIYLPPFEAAVRQAGAWAVMSAYNRINGTHAAEHPLLTTVLKEEWGFDGLVMSDWWGTHSTEASARAGLDLEMPGPPIHLGAALEAAVDQGRVPEATVDDMVRRRLRLQQRTGGLPGAADGPANGVSAEPAEQAVDDPADRALIRRAGAAAVVLLSNPQRLLPLDGGGPGRVVVIGPTGDALALQGGGSARVEPHRQVSVLDALRQRLGDVGFEPGCRIDRGIPPLERQMVPLPVAAEDGGGGAAGFTLEYFAGPDFEGPPVRTERRRRLELTWLGEAAPGLPDGPFTVRARGTLRPAATGRHTFSLVSAGASRLLVDGELVLDNWTAPTRGDSFYGLGSTRLTAERQLTEGRPAAIEVEYRAPEIRAVMGVTAGCQGPNPADELERAVALAAGADTVVLVVGTGPEWETEGRDRETMDLPDRQDELVHRVAAANPRTVVVVNTAAPVSMPWADEVAAVLQAWFPGQEGGDAIADVLLGQAEPGGRLPITIPVRVSDCPADLTYPGEAGTVSYGEGIFVGYRGYERRGVAPRYCFGHGLSYTTFAYGPVALDAASVGPDEPVVVRVPVTNTGTRRGSEVVQVYLRDVERSLLRPDRELAGFTKLELDPGQSDVAHIVVAPRALAAWDPRVQHWVAEPGTFEVLVGSSSADIRSSVRFDLIAGPAGTAPAEPTP